MRKYYIDNVRILCVLLLFPFHSTYIFNNLNESFYINGTPSEALTAVDLCVYPWWMTGLFVLAGISAMYALKKRTAKQFLIERVKRLLIPLIVAIVIIIPPQTYIADVFHNGYTGGYFEHYKVFFTLTDFSGYDGHFIVPRVESVYLAWVIITIGSFVVTIGLYEIFKRFKVTRFLLSIK